MLGGKTIWITRPEGQADKLMTGLGDAGATVRQLPMLAIRPLEVTDRIKNVILGLDRYDLLFFISNNAAELGMKLIEDYWPQFPVGVAVYALGPTTAGKLGDFGVVAEYPGERMSSEALLSLDSLQDISGRKALIVRGVGGRELLAQALLERGASVDYLELYERFCPVYARGELARLYADDKPDAVIVTSAEALANLASLLVLDKLDPSALAVFVSSQRIADNARLLGFSSVHVMPGADDKAIIGSLQETL